MYTKVITSKKYFCDNCHYPFIISREEEELPTNCPFCNTPFTCGAPDISFDGYEGNQKSGK